ncbi:HNH endonuclease [Hypericibacter terrae]|uniref:Putative HNH nuclease YajD n=1 Tax=Hypericibacter terrae TaxID=2602015 RepID=A0A5J6MR36_9PROT|nr:HNH endonuclease signature motif containing protein [Hypericibacter terrae]QEX18510.1 HNH endonuclease [Hypericibacter terrae]
MPTRPPVHRPQGARTEAQRKADYDQRRGTARKRGYDSRWDKARKAYLAKHPLCVKHEAKGETVAAIIVDHIIPHRGDKALFWDSDNWQPLCKPCHDAKTATEDSAFANRAPRS